MRKDLHPMLGSLRAISIDQGRSALLIALKTIRVKKGNEILVPSFICNVVIDAVLEAGGIPVLVDSSREDFKISIASVRQKISASTKAIIAPHLFGVPCNITELQAIAKENNLCLIEDCANTINARFNGKNIGTCGDLAFFSFNFDKPISTGNGGMLLVNNPNLVESLEATVTLYNRVSLANELEIVCGLIIQYLLTERIVYNEQLLISFGYHAIKKNNKLSSIVDDLLKNPQLVERIAINLQCLLKSMRLLPYIRSSYLSRGVNKIRSVLGRNRSRAKIDRKDLLMNSLRTLIGIEQLKHINSVNNVRNTNAQLLDNGLDQKSYDLPRVEKVKVPTFLRYSILNNTRIPTSKIYEAGRNKGFEVGNYNWPFPIHLLYPYDRILTYERGSLQNSEYITKNLINLPIHYYVSKNEIEEMIEILNRFGSGNIA